MKEEKSQDSDEMKNCGFAVRPVTPSTSVGRYILLEVIGINDIIILRPFYATDVMIIQYDSASTPF